MNKLGEILDAAGVKQCDLARAVKRSRGYISQLVNHHRQAGGDTMGRIALFLGRSVDEIFYPTCEGATDEQ